MEKKIEVKLTIVTVLLQILLIISYPVHDPVAVCTDILHDCSTLTWDVW